MHRTYCKMSSISSHVQIQSKSDFSVRMIPFMTDPGLLVGQLKTAPKEPKCISTRVLAVSLRHYQASTSGDNGSEVVVLENVVFAIKRDNFVVWISSN